MSEITTDQNNGSGKSKVDKDGNEISHREKRIAGIIMIFFMIMCTMGIIAYWPDRLPDPKKDIAPLYQHKLFNICLVGIPQDICCPDSSYKQTIEQDTSTKATVRKNAGNNNDTTKNKDSVDQKIDTGKSASGKPPAAINTIKNNSAVPFWLEKSKGKLIHLNTILLLLVALGGFLGNMIHITTSFTTYVGSGKFKRSWLLWYCLKPFTASALAIGIYFIFRAGFLNMSDGGQSINLYGLMSISVLAGLFTDKATEKLKEIFEVIFKAKEQRPDTLVDQFKITGISPTTIEKEKENKLILIGENLGKQKLIVTINNEKVTNPLFTSSAINISYKIPDSQLAKDKFMLSVKDEKGTEHFSAILDLKP